MLERFAWIHISDLHFRIGQSEWAQNVVARDLLQDIANRVQDWAPLQFAVVSGDLAFSGDSLEYRLVGGFLEEFRTTLGLAKKRLFIVPGNHDVIRSVQKTCYVGARELLTSPQDVDQFLGDTPERNALLERQEHFRLFEAEFRAEGDWELTPDDLGYIASLDVDGLPVAVAGLNSAWLCGGVDDFRNILVGERQVIDVLQLLDAKQHSLVIGVLHHPTSWLRDFDQTAFQARLSRRCDFLHRGHMHEPHVSLVQDLSGEGCVVVGAGATFSGRHFRNSYSVVILDLSEAGASIHTYGYANGQFEEESPKPVPFRLRTPLPGTCEELAGQIAQIAPACPAPDYLAALVWERKTEVPIPLPDGPVIFGSLALLDELAAQHAVPARRFLQLRNLLRANPHHGLEQCIDSCRQRIEAYSQWLADLAASSGEFSTLLRQQNVQARGISERRGCATAQPRYACHLMDEMEGDGEWEQLETTSLRYMDSKDTATATHARRMRGHCLVRHTDPASLADGAALLEDVARSTAGQAADLLIGCAALLQLSRFGPAKDLLTYGLKRFPEAILELKRLGHTLVLQTGDKALRAALGNL